MTRVTRRRLLAILVPLGLVFLVLAFGVARFLTVENVERQKIFDVLRDEARGDAGAVAGRLAGCDGPCRARVAAAVAKVRGPGEVKIVRLDSGTAYSLGTAEGTTRVVWIKGPVNGVPVVQCIPVRRSGNPVTGRSVTLLALGAPLASNEDAC